MKWSERLHTLGFKLFVYTFISLMAVALLVSYVSYNRASMALQDQVRSASDQTIIQAANQLNLVLDVYRTLSKQIQLNQTLRQQLNDLQSADYGTQQQINEQIIKQLTAYRDSHPSIFGVRLVNKDATLAQNPSEDDQIPKLSSTPNKGMIVGPWQLDWLKKIIGADGKLLWVPTRQASFFETKTNLEMPTFTLGMLFKNMGNRSAEYIVLIEVHADVLKPVFGIMNADDESELALVDPSGASLLPVEYDSENGNNPVPVPPDRTNQIEWISASQVVAGTGWVIRKALPVSSLLPELTDSAVQTFVLMSLLSISVSLLISFFVERKIARRIKALSVGAEELAAIQASGLQGITIRTKDTEKKDEIGELDGAIHVLSDLMEHIRITSAQLQALLDHSEQGFLSVGPSLTIHPAYSSACDKWLNTNGDTLTGTPVSLLLYPDEAQDMQRSMLEQQLTDVFEAPNAMIRQLMTDLLEQELWVRGRLLHMRCKIIDNETLMFIISDVTETRALQSAMEREHRTLNMVVRIVANDADFRVLIHDFRYFANTSIPYWFGQKKEQPGWRDELYRQVHTFKGNFGQFGMIEAARFAHEFENELEERKVESFQELSQWLTTVRFEDWIEPELAVVEKMVGARLKRTGETVSFENRQIERFEQQVRDMLSDDQREEFENAWRELQYQPLSQLLTGYIESIYQLASRMEKAINPITIEDHHELVDPIRMYPFIKTLTHVFRNMVDHGLESTEERIDAGKPECGTIRIVIEPDPDDHHVISRNLTLKISDDGRGIDPDKVREKAVKAGLLKPESAAEMPDHEVIWLIFSNGFSTRDETSEVSGRGVGLYAVLIELERIGGNVDLESVPGEGTTFIFRFDGLG